jgi:hypothetical protein
VSTAEFVGLLNKAKTKLKPAPVAEDGRKPKPDEIPPMPVTATKDFFGSCRKPTNPLGQVDPPKEKRDPATGSLTTELHGTVGDRTGRINLEAKLEALAESIGLKGFGFDLTHLWPHTWGNEQRAGIYLAGHDANVSYLGRAESFIRGLYDESKQTPGSWVEVTATAITHDRNAYINPADGNPVGANLLAGTDYHVVRCIAGKGDQPDQLETYDFGVRIAPPTVNGSTVIPGAGSWVP